ncbi:monocarboxylate transporter 2-like [Neosynchiropus ocellatus]
MPAVSTDSLGYKPPDGGWGWVVVFAAHISIGFAYSTPKVLTIFFKSIQQDLDASYSDIAWISSIMLAVMYAGGPISSMLVTRFGSRPIVVLGGLMGAVAMVTASFADSIAALYMCIGIIGGCGLAFNLNASVTIISKYFLVRRPLANGLAMAGSPVFLACLAPLNQLLLSNYGWRGSLIVFGGLMLNCCVAGSLMRPVLPRKPPAQKLQKETVSCDRKAQASRCLKGFLDLSHFKDRGFVIYLIGNIFFFFGAYAPIVFMSSYAISRDVEEYSAAYLLSIMGFVDMVVRPTTGLVANSKWIRPRVQYLFSFAVLFTGVCHLVCPLMHTYGLLVFYTVMFGVGFGMVFALIFECLMDLMGNQRFPSAVGLVTIIECFPMLLGPPAAGLMVDVYGDYRYLYLMCGAVTLTGGVFLFIMNFFNYHMLDKEKKSRARDGESRGHEGVALADEVKEPGDTPKPEVEVKHQEPDVPMSEHVKKNGVSV